MTEEIKYSQLISENRRLAGQLTGEPLNILLLSNAVAGNAKDFMEFELRRIGINATVDLGQYDNLLQQTYNVSHHVVVVFFEPWNFTAGFYSHVGAKLDQLIDLEQNIKQQILTIAENTRHIPLLVFNTFLPTLDLGVPFQHSPLKKLVNSLNQFLFELQQANLFVFDTNEIINQLSFKEALSRKNFYQFNTLFTNSFFRLYSAHFRFLVFAILGKTKKALILDCDNTLWKGIVGEDGPDSLQMAFDQPWGRPYYEVQRMVLDLSKKGVIVGLCSKNNPEDVQHVLDQHPDIQLGNDDIVIKKINWKPKPENIKEIARDLNIGLDSMVFWDDSNFEIQMMKEALPEVLSFKVPEKIYEYPDYFRNQSAWFFKLHDTSEDAEKAFLYKQEAIRKEESKKFQNINKFLAALSLEVSIEKNPSAFADRLAQLTQKTNQFNLSSHRYTKSEIENFLSRADLEVIPFHVKDRFGSYGLTGLCIIRYEDGRLALIDTFLLSCRILGRQVEDAFLWFLVNHLKKREVVKLVFPFISNTKNDQVGEFFKTKGFEMKIHSSQQIDYFCNPRTFIAPEVEFVKINF